MTRAHIDDKPLDINAAYARFVRLAHLRVKAYGYKWYRWYSRQQFREYPKVVPLKHRQKKLMEVRTRCGVPDRTDAKSRIEEST